MALFDIIGDLHGCCDDLEALLVYLGYKAHEPPLLRCDVTTARMGSGRGHRSTKRCMQSNQPLLAEPTSTP
jgi:hypothetical protein